MSQSDDFQAGRLNSAGAQKCEVSASYSPYLCLITQGKTGEKPVPGKQYSLQRMVVTPVHTGVSLLTRFRHGGRNDNRTGMTLCLSLLGKNRCQANSTVSEQMEYRSIVEIEIPNHNSQISNKSQ
jgi:hypothetical protein